MPYPSNLYLNPSNEFKQTWSLVPQVRTLSVAGQKTKSLYSSLSPAIPLFYILMFLAIGFDVYLALKILAKQGVPFGLILISVIADLFFAIAPFLIETFLWKGGNHVKVENQIFQCKLECQTMKKSETNEEFQARRAKIIEGELKEYKSKKFWNKVLRTILVLLIFSIAAWKIYTFYKVLPPGLSIFSLVNGKIVIIFSILCAIFHIIGSEKAIAHFWFWRIKRSELKTHRHTFNGQKPEAQEEEIDYKGTYKDCSSGNTTILNKDGVVYLQYIHIIKDDEIQSLVNVQTDDNAKRGIAIKCKENQII